MAPELNGQRDFVAGRASRIDSSMTGTQYSQGRRLLKGFVGLIVKTPIGFVQIFIRGFGLHTEAPIIAQILCILHIHYF